MDTHSGVSRRDFLSTGALGGTALIVGFYWPRAGRAQSGHVPGPGTLEANAWIAIAQDDQITLLTEIPEMGQGTRTADAMMLADELEADWSAIRVEQAPTIPQSYKHLGTGGSGGTSRTWMPMRRAGAQARELLLRAAAQRWRVTVGECRAYKGTIIHTPTGRKFRYGQLVETASTLQPVKPDRAPLKSPKDFRFIGKPIPRVDVPGKVDGSAVFGIDVRVPGMLFAVIARCPHFGGKLASCDDSLARATPGVRSVFYAPPIGLMPVAPGVARNINVSDGVAVVADSTWAAIQGRKALKIAWNKALGPTKTPNLCVVSSSGSSQARQPSSPSIVATLWEFLDTAPRGSTLNMSYHSKRMPRWNR
jgi:isoquinoline 1-oxidoreductase subunit beta